MADMHPSYGLLVAQIRQTGADRPSGIVPRGVGLIWVSGIVLISGTVLLGGSVSAFS